MQQNHTTKTDINADLEGNADPGDGNPGKVEFTEATEFLKKLKSVRSSPNTEDKLKEFAEYVEARYPFDYDKNADIIDANDKSKIADAVVEPLSYGDFEPNKTPELVSLMPFLGLAELTEGLYFYAKFHRLQAIKIQTSTVVIPNEPYTPILKNISLDYTASADSQNADIDFYQLLPFPNSFKAQALDGKPELLYTIEDEGSLFIGVQNLTPGSVLNLYFQMAEATADSEFDPAQIKWAYIKDNEWQELRDQFQVLEDGTQGFTRSGIVKILVPGDISAENVTLLPPTEEPLFWLKASAATDTASICETIAVYTQAVKATASLQADNDTNRLAEPLPKESLDKLAQVDSAINTVLQPDASRGGAPPETDDSTHYYTRVSERLRHKDRGVNAFDYERIVLEAFPGIQTVKCITHSMSLPGSSYRQDLHLAPGFVSLALIPNLDELKSGNSATPKAPSSMLNEIKDHLQARVSPFVQLKVVNPRYEAVHVELDVQFQSGLNASFYLKELAREIRLHLTPWLNGDQSKLCFAHGASQSDLVGFVESRPYVDFISCISMKHEDESIDPDCKSALVEIEGQISPRTARSILLAGNITTRQFAEVYCERYEPHNNPPPQ